LVVGVGWGRAGVWGGRRRKRGGRWVAGGSRWGGRQMEGVALQRIVRPPAGDG
jgi:hypothetical protein